MHRRDAWPYLSAFVARRSPGVGAGWEIDARKSRGPEEDPAEVSRRRESLGLGGAVASGRPVNALSLRHGAPRYLGKVFVGYATLSEVDKVEKLCLGIAELPATTHRRDDLRSLRVRLAFTREAKSAFQNRHSRCLCGSEHAQHRGILAEICPSLLATLLSPTGF